jgi:hypothetical protein
MLPVYFEAGRHSCPILATCMRCLTDPILTETETLHASFEVLSGAAVLVILDVSKGHGAFILQGSSSPKRTNFLHCFHYDALNRRELLVQRRRMGFMVCWTLKLLCLPGRLSISKSKETDRQTEQLTTVLTVQTVVQGEGTSSE